MSRDVVALEGLKVDCIVGIRPDERVREQSLDLDLRFGLDASSAAYHGRIAATVDYARVADEVAAILRFRRYRLLEMAGEEIAAMLLGVHRAAHEVAVTIRKPGALPGRAAAAAVTVRRRAADLVGRRELTTFGEVEVLLETREAGLYLLHVEPGRAIPPHFHRIMRELEWLVDGQLERDGRRLEDFSPVCWQHERVHTYENRSDHRATLFCCDCPPFLSHDEVVVQDEP
jgi:FolB domain-containing protein